MEINTISHLGNEMQLDRLEEEAQAYFPEDEWGIDIIRFANGEATGVAFHTQEKLKSGIALREYLWLKDGQPQTSIWRVNTESYQSVEKENNND